MFKTVIRRAYQFTLLVGANPAKLLVSRVSKANALNS
jgi:hypothetical protein